ncbi:MAG: hypothetical protein JNM72_23790 [Deltaproteobacteria bacterium]|nr:hypothetical protein [Deltaproteobacteria bacterium]
MAQRLTWSEIKHNPTVFARDFARSTREQTDATEFWNDFFAIFGLKRTHVAAFEAPVKKPSGPVGKIDLTWPGVMVADHNTAERSLSRVEAHAFASNQGLITDGRASETPRYIVAFDVQHIVLHDLKVEEGGAGADEASGPAPRNVEIKLAELPNHPPPNGNATLADLYDPDTMPPGLVKAHQALDKAVDKLYRPDRAFGSDRERVEWLFELFAAQQAPLMAGVEGKKKAKRNRTTK